MSDGEASSLNFGSLRKCMGETLLSARVPSQSVGGRKAGGKWPSAKECATQREFGLKKMILGDLIRIPDRLPATAPVCVGGVVG
jgi:hypothetical protein